MSLGCDRVWIGKLGRDEQGKMKSRESGPTRGGVPIVEGSGDVGESSREWRMGNRDRQTVVGVRVVQLGAERGRRRPEF